MVFLQFLNFLKIRPQKLAWKHFLNVNFAIEAEWKSDIEQKSSLKYVNPETLGVGKCHPIWSTVKNNLIDTRRAQLKCKLLTGSYILQGNRAAFNQYQVDPTCKLCSAAPETRQHFLAEWPMQGSTLGHKWLLRLAQVCTLIFILKSEPLLK